MQSDLSKRDAGMQICGLESAWSGWLDVSFSQCFPSLFLHVSFHPAFPVYCSLIPLVCHSFISSCPLNPFSLPSLLIGGSAQWWTTHERLNRRSEFKGTSGVVWAWETCFIFLLILKNNLFLLTRVVYAYMFMAHNNKISLIICLIPLPYPTSHRIGQLTFLPF